MIRCADYDGADVGSGVDVYGAEGYGGWTVVSGLVDDCSIDLTILRS